MECDSVHRAPQRRADILPDYDDDSQYQDVEEIDRQHKEWLHQLEMDRLYDEDMRRQYEVGMMSGYEEELIRRHGEEMARQEENETVWERGEEELYYRWMSGSVIVVQDRVEEEEEQSESGDVVDISKLVESDVSESDVSESASEEISEMELEQEISQEIYTERPLYRSVFGRVNRWSHKTNIGSPDHLPSSILAPISSASKVPLLLYRVYDEYSVSQYDKCTGFTAGALTTPATNPEFRAMIENHIDWSASVQTPFISVTRSLDEVKRHVNMRLDRNRPNIMVAMIDSRALVVDCKTKIWALQDIFIHCGILPPHYYWQRNIVGEYLCFKRIPRMAVLECCDPADVVDRANIYIKSGYFN